MRLLGNYLYFDLSKSVSHQKLTLFEGVGQTKSSTICLVFDQSCPLWSYCMHIIIVCILFTLTCVQVHVEHYS